MEFAQFRIRICPVIAHHQISNDRGILRLYAEDVVPLDPDAVANLNNEEGNRIFFLQFAQIGHRNGRRRNRDLAPEKNGEGCRRSAHGDIANLPESITLQIRDASIIIVRRRVGCGIICRRVTRCSAVQEGIDLLLRDHLITHSLRHLLL